MTAIGPPKPSLKKRPRQRATVTVSQESMVKMGPLLVDSSLPLIVEPAVDNLNLHTWAEGNREMLNTHLLRDGGILFRGWNVASIDEFERFTQAMASSDLLDYTYRSTPRSEVSGKVYSSTEYPKDESIPLHNEMAYTKTWPLRIWFYSVTVAEQGGETPIADSRKVYQRLDPLIRDRFAEKRILYVRNYGGGLDLPWQNVFQTNDKAAVEAFCKENDIECEWKDGDRLRTRQICQAVAKHPHTGEMLWFNQAHLFHVTSVKRELRERFLAEFAPEDLPRNTYYGDGTPIEESVLNEIRGVLDETAVKFPWQQGDILMLDNMLVAHGRSPFQGERKVVVTMAGAWSDAGIPG